MGSHGLGIENQSSQSFKFTRFGLKTHSMRVRPA
jgi:hypothetical protein